MDRIATTPHAAVGGNPDAGINRAAGQRSGYLNARQVQAATGPAGSRIAGNHASAAGPPVPRADEPTTGHLCNAPAILPQPVVRRSYQPAWRRFTAWCAEYNLPHLPASPETVAAYLRNLPQQAKIGSIRFERSVIGVTHGDAGLDNPSASELVRATIAELAIARQHPRTRVLEIRNQPLHAADVASVRDAALSRRRHLPPEQSSDSARQHRRLVDAALCSVVLEAGLRYVEAAALEWRDLKTTVDGNRTLTIRTRTPGAAKNITISEQVYADLQAIADGAQPHERIFGLEGQQIGDHIRSAAKAAGYEVKVNGCRSARQSLAWAEAGSSDTVAQDLRHWQTFTHWCHQQRVAILPASPKTLAAYFKHLANSSSTGTLIRVRAVIVKEHEAAKLPNPWENELLQEQFRTLSSQNLSANPGAIDSRTLDAIRTTAVGRQPQGDELHSEDSVPRRRLVDIALCSSMHAARLSASKASELQWRDVRKVGEHHMQLFVMDKRSIGSTGRVVDLTGQVVHELEAIRGGAGPDDKIFGLSASALYARVKAARQVAGLDPMSRSAEAWTDL